MELITPTQFIYEVALKTETVPLSMGKIVEYHDMEFSPVSDETCYLCGGQTNRKGKSVAKAILPTFTDRDKAREPRSNAICAGCAWCLSFRELRNYSIIATKDTLVHPTRPEIRHYLLSPPEPPFVFCIATSGQKWLHFRSDIAYSSNNFPVQFEETRVYVSVDSFRYLLGLIEKLYTAFSKEEILTGCYNQNRIRQYGITSFQQIEEEISKYRGQRQFNVAVFVAQKEES